MPFVSEMSADAGYVPRMKPMLALAALMLMLPHADAQADDVGLARDLVQAGKILPLSRILDMLEQQHPGQVTEVELEIEDGILVYEVDLITAQGRLIEVDINAATGEIVDIDDEEAED